jgi:hypothetical protein
VAFAAALVILSLGLPFASAVQRSHPGLAQIWDTMRVQQGPRDAALHRLETVPGKHLVFVRYSPHHPWYDEWVFNGADIPGSRVVFARMCSPESDMALARSMKDRDVWIASPDTGPLVARVTLSELLVANADNRH